VAAFVFDSSSPESFAAARALMEQVSTLAGCTLPCVLVAAKDELVMSAALEAEVARAAADMRVSPPHCTCAPTALRRHVPVPVLVPVSHAE
jgi:hypothetical protein